MAISTQLSPTKMNPTSTVSAWQMEMPSATPAEGFRPSFELAQIPQDRVG
jgi:hypothetical protein